MRGTDDDRATEDERMLSLWPTTGVTMEELRRRFEGILNAIANNSHVGT